MHPPSFERDERTDAGNRARRGIALAPAHDAVVEPHPVIAEDTAHSAKQKLNFSRELGSGIPAVSLVCRADVTPSLRRRRRAQGKAIDAPEHRMHE